MATEARTAHKAAFVRTEAEIRRGAILSRCRRPTVILVFISSSFGLEL
jgi:hypothetical protein